MVHRNHIYNQIPTDQNISPYNLIGLRNEGLSELGLKAMEVPHGGQVKITADTEPISQLSEDVDMLALLELAGSAVQVLRIKEAGKTSIALAKGSYNPAAHDKAERISVDDNIHRGILIVGRENYASQLGLDKNPAVSRSHATVIKAGENGTVHVADHSMNGTWVIARAKSESQPEPKKSRLSGKLAKLALGKNK